MNPQEVIVHDKKFEIFITKAEIKARILDLGRELTKKYKDLNPVFITILNGSFMFAADMVRACGFDSEMMFITLKSYEGMESTGEIKGDFRLPGSVEDRHIIILEDIVDTGNTLHFFIDKLKENKPKAISICTLLLKPKALQHPMDIEYIGFKIPNAFVVGYGLDYDEYGRTLPDIYQLAEK